MTTSTVAPAVDFTVPPRLCVDFGEEGGFLKALPFYKLGDALKALVLPLLAAPLQEVESNWCVLDLVFSTEVGQHELKEARLNGPKLGRSDVSTLLRERVPRSVWHLLRAHVAVGEQQTDGRVQHKFRNADYTFEFVPERTCLTLSDGDVGAYVESVDGQQATLVSWSSWFEEEDEHESMSCENLQAEIRGEVEYAYTSVYYLSPGESAATKHDERKKELFLEHEAYMADRPRREAAQALAREAEEKAKAYAALSPEEKAEQDAFDARMAAQASIVRGLAPFLPQP